MSKLYKRGGRYVVEGLNLSQVNEMYLEQGDYLPVDVKLIDGRVMSPKQRRFIFALCYEVESYSGLDRELFRAQAMAQNTRQNEVAKSSMAQYDMTEANQLIEIIIDFFITNSIPLDQSILEQNEYRLTQNHIYSMILQRKCAVCGKYADIHHSLTHVGMGRDRNKISHIGMTVLPLCRPHHNEAHTIGDKAFNEKYILEPVVVDEKLEYFIKGKKIKLHKED